MYIRLKRFMGSAVDTLGELYINDKFACFTLEDEHRDVKVKGETRIPAGIYQTKLTYSPKYKKDMLEIMNVPNFTGIRIHTGNDKDDTEGCILVGDAVAYNPMGKSVIVAGFSSPAYNRIYPEIVSALETGDVFITIQDES